MQIVQCTTQFINSTDSQNAPNIIFTCTLTQVLFTAIEQVFRSRLKIQLVKLGITNNGSTQHG